MRVCRDQDKRPRPLLSVYLTTEIPSIRDKTTAVEAIIPDLTLIKVIIVFFFCYLQCQIHETRPIYKHSKS